MLAGVRVIAFNQLLLVVDREIAIQHTTELVVTAPRETGRHPRTMGASVRIAGNGYQLQLPPAADAGFAVGDRAPCQSADGMLVIINDNGTAAGADAARLAHDLTTIRSDRPEYKPVLDCSETAKGVSRLLWNPHKACKQARD